MQDFFSIFKQSLKDNSFVKISIGNYKGTEDLKNIYIKRILIKREEKLNFVFRYKTKDITKNYSTDEALESISKYLKYDSFRVLVLFTTQNDFNFELNKQNEWQCKKLTATMLQTPNLQHNIEKQRKVSATGKRYLYDLKITDIEGKVYKNAQDKFKQINHFIELLSSVLHKIPSKDTLHVVDMGAGKGYLTFALYDYLTQNLAKSTEMTGVEFRTELVDLCNEYAKNSGFNQLKFVQGSIENYKAAQIDILIALHACDTATDDAIKIGIDHKADLIVVAPCCHKQIRREIEKNNVKTPLESILKHGIYLERQSEMITDAMRVLVLEYYGYKTKVVEFISDIHTPKNVLIIAEKLKNSVKNEAKLKELRDLKAFFGIETFYMDIFKN